jgi:uncharacterized NAD(P)/FAD-binding protein YdhS
MQSVSRTIAIIGGGFSGTVLAANLLRRPPSGPTRIILVERQEQLGCGVAYARTAHSCLLNVPAGRMSASSDEPLQLVEWARLRRADVSPDTYLPRQLYSEYLRSFLETARRRAPSHVQLERIHGEATAIHAPGTSRVARAPFVVCVAGKQLLADQVILACGDPPPVAREYAAAVADHPAYVLDPHRHAGASGADNTVLLIGTGLTMTDMAVALTARRPTVRLIALSRHGLLPASQATQSRVVLDTKLDLAATLAAPSLRALVAGAREIARIAQQRGGDWREAVTRVREVVPVLWNRFNPAQRAQFLRHARVYWDVHRHRMPPVVADRIRELTGSGQLQVHAGRIHQLRAAGERITVRWRPRGQSQAQQITVDRVLECSGSDCRLERTGDRLLRQLLESGYLCPDSTGLGLRTGVHGAVMDALGRPATQLFYLGPMLRADHWEAVAVGELRQRAEQLAAALAAPAQAHALAPVLPPPRRHPRFALTRGQTRARYALSEF